MGGHTVRVVNGGELLVTATQDPPLLPKKSNAYSVFFLDATGSNDMGVNGSVTPVDFYISASDEATRFIKRISFAFGYGSSAESYEFADSGAALTNGVRIWYKNDNGDMIDIANPKANLSFMRGASGGISTTNWQARGFAAAGDYGYFVNWDLCGLTPGGIQLDKGSKQRMIITIRDDCTDADLFNCKAFGFERLPYDS